MGYKIGNKVRVVKNESGGFEEGVEAEVIKVVAHKGDHEEFENLLLQRSVYTFWHVDDEVELVSSNKQNT